MPIRLIVQPRQVYTWTEFKKETPPYSIALDGIVNDRTRRTTKGPYANFDHHCRVDRGATRSTSDQVSLEINMGLFKTFDKDGIPEANVYVNDPDEDTCLAYWLLQNHERVIGHAEPPINRLVYMEDRLDATAGAYPFGDSSMRRTMAWMFEPYNSARFEGRLKGLDAKGMETVIEAVSGRISKYAMGQGQQLALDGQYEIVGGGKGWSMVKETGPAARLAMYNDGIEAFVAIIAEKGNRYHYSVGRKSHWVPFPLRDIFESASHIDADEGIEITEANDWGPQEESATIGGSPRSSGSSLSPKILEGLINEILAKDE